MHLTFPLSHCTFCTLLLHHTHTAHAHTRLDKDIIRIHIYIYLNITWFIDPFDEDLLTGSSSLTPLALFSLYTHSPFPCPLPSRAHIHTLPPFPICHYTTLFGDSSHVLGVSGYLQTGGGMVSIICPQALSCMYLCVVCFSSSAHVFLCLHPCVYRLTHYSPCLLFLGWWLPACKLPLQKTCTHHTCHHGYCCLPFAFCVYALSSAWPWAGFPVLATLPRIPNVIYVMSQ